MLVGQVVGGDVFWGVEEARDQLVDLAEVVGVDGGNKPGKLFRIVILFHQVVTNLSLAPLSPHKIGLSKVQLV